MHYRAKRGLAIACRLSVRPSLTLVDQGHIGWKSRKLIARTISPTPLLFVAQIPSTYCQGNMWRFWGDRGGAGKKVPCWSTKAAVSLKRVKIAEKLLWRAYRNSPTLFRTVPSRPPTASSSPRFGDFNTNLWLMRAVYNVGTTRRCLGSKGLDDGRRDGLVS